MVTKYGAGWARGAVAACALIVCGSAATSSANAMQQAGQAGAAPQRGAVGANPAAARPDPTTAQEVQRLFEAYVVIRAQEALKLDDEKFTAFLPKLKALQDVRRRGEQTHNQLVAELNRLTAPGTQFEESKARDTLKALQDSDARTAETLRKAYEAVDQMLDVFQQARFRVFEVQMERRKIDLLLQARRADAAKKEAEPTPVIKKSPAS
jgi:hypothetical protein